MTDEILEKYPGTYAIYDTGKYYGVARYKEAFYLVDKSNLNIVKRIARFSKECTDIIEKAIPIYYEQDED